MDRRIVDNEELTESCRSIFGDIVKKAYKTPYYNKYDYQVEIEILDDGDIIGWDAQEFIIEFTNGARVLFRNSECASLERII